MLQPGPGPGEWGSCSGDAETQLPLPCDADIPGTSETFIMPHIWVGHSGEG